jgi:hypothetical protein
MAKKKRDGDVGVVKVTESLGSIPSTAKKRGGGKRERERERERDGGTERGRRRRRRRRKKGGKEGRKEGRRKRISSSYMLVFWLRFVLFCFK